MLISKPLRKKGGIFIKKILFFLITILCISFTKNINVYAATVNFYEAEYIDNIYMNKRAEGSNTIFYQKARFFRENTTNNHAYCIEPFKTFIGDSTYQDTTTPSNLSTYQYNRIKLLAHFGYGYSNHTDSKWYAITQFMIWQTAEPTGDFYFTDSLNGRRIEKFTDEMNEINNLIENYQKIPSIVNNEYTIVEGEKININDTNNILNNYTVSDNNFQIINNTLVSDELTEGIYDITLTRQSKIHNKKILFFWSPISQDLIETGDIEDKNYKLKVNVIKTSIELTKIDHDTTTTTPSGEGKLIGSIYTLYNSNMEKIQDIEINEKSIGLVENIKFGKYYLKETKANDGYTLDDKTYEIDLTKDNKNIKLTLENKIIEAKIIINKKYEDNPNKEESNVTFNIYNNDDELIKTLTTNDDGVIETILPYGKYTVKQLNTKDGYCKVDDFKIDITNNETKTYYLTDYKIKVPNTKTHTNIFIKIIKFLLNLCTKTNYQ